MKKKLVLLLMAIITLSCKKQITIDLPDMVNQPVINLLMAKDSFITALVTKSQYLGPMNSDPRFGFSTIPDAKVTLYENGGYKEELQRITNIWGTYYKSTVKARPGIAYRVTVAVNGYPEMEGTDSIPPSTIPGNLTFRKVASDDSKSKANITLELIDKPGEKNYYRIRMYEHLTDNDTTMALAGLSFISSDPYDILFGKKERREFFTDDQFFDGHTRRLNFIVSSDLGFKHPLELEVTTLTYSSYNYLFSSFLAEEKNEDVLSEKVIVFSNVLHGLGIVGGMSIERYKIIY
ncbi:protein of unknown function [Chitinophaga eiseniae]|uniref:DUF4249 domain-containing protein n=1 Tax=Chitinophaga eiseniae TaxID=634771 RepID=A0A1T4T6V4_9BACT|nr:DUF4249 domain-containing protein [Chitinophaga eiseniae]SKA36049.1 protein of unknown function [Chitinophaga eiseniae]